MSKKLITIRKGFKIYKYIFLTDVNENNFLFLLNFCKDMNMTYALEQGTNEKEISFNEAYDLKDKLNELFNNNYSIIINHFSDSRQELFFEKNPYRSDNSMDEDMTVKEFMAAYLEYKKGNYHNV